MARKRLSNASGQTVEVISNLAFRVEAGRIGALIGPSGCGKSTLMRIIAGLDDRLRGRGEASRRTSGNGVPGAAAPAVAQRRGQHSPRGAAGERGRDRDSAGALGLAEHRAHYPGELSLGLAKRVALARAFAVRPALLLLDEPFVSLDAPLALALQRELAALVAGREVTTVLVTHDVGEAIRLADRIFVLSPRPARVVGEIGVENPRDAMSGAEARALEARIEALRS